MTGCDGTAGSAEPGLLAARLRRVVGDLVRATRGDDVLAPIPADVMGLLDREGPLTTADLAVRRQVRHQTMAATVRDLQDLGYVSAVPDPADGRKKVLSLTAVGRSALDDDRERRVRRLAGAIAGSLSDAEVRALARTLVLLERVTAAIAADACPGRPGRSPVAGDW